MLCQKLANLGHRTDCFQREVTRSCSGTISFFQTSGVYMHASIPSSHLCLEPIQNCSHRLLSVSHMSPNNTCGRQNICFSCTTWKGTLAKRQIFLVNPQLKAYFLSPKNGTVHILTFSIVTFSFVNCRGRLYRTQALFQRASGSKACMSLETLCGCNPLPPHLAILGQMGSASIPYNETILTHQACQKRTFQQTYHTRSVF